MKNKVNILLIAVVLIIYGRIFWSQSSDNPIENQLVLTPVSSQVISKPLAEHHVNLKFNDPFLKRYNKSNKKSLIKLTKPHAKPKPAPVTNERVKADLGLTFLGRFLNQTKNTSNALIRLNNQELIINEGDSVENFMVYRIKKDELIIKLSNKKLTYVLD